MVDFRKWLFVLVGAGLLLGIGSSAANAQGTLQCTTTAGGGVNVNIRNEGITELVGDLIINCTGGTPTAPTVAIPLENIQISINTNITSRIEDPTNNVSEALLLIDSPYPATGEFPVPPNAGAQPPSATNNALTQLACVALNSINCAIISKGVGVGTPGNYDGTAGHFNVFQGYQSGANTISWNGVPIDAPGTAGTRVIRITNVRANAFQLTGGSTLIPTQIFMIVSVNGSAVLNLNQPSTGSVVATIVPGLITSSTTGAFQQCIDLNPSLLHSTDSGQTGTITVTAKEGFAAAFKTQNFTQLYNVSENLTGSPHNTTYSPPGVGINLQNIPGFNYNSESGLYLGGGIGLDQATTEPAGLADRGTQIQFSIGGVGSGVSLFAPSYAYLDGFYGVGQTVGVAVLVSQTAGGTGAITNSSGIPVALEPGTGITPAPGPLVSVNVSGSVATLVYEIYYADPSVQETLSLPISAAFITTGPTNPAPTTTPSTIAINYAPLNPAGVTAVASSTEPIPNFGQPHAAVPLLTISPCTCNLLFPFVSNQAGFDTGIAIANTSSDTLNNVTPQSGTIVLSYYGNTTGGGAAPANTPALGPVPAGQELIFTLSTGGNFATPATPGFEGYIIAQANFQYCHGFAFVSPVGAQGNGAASAGYLAIQLDQPGLNRTLNIGENKAH